ncbi:DUF3810 domain-containing protein [Mesonia maritima]|uniref:DUF3810 domain-containing protein n=1 Tax=Mesonia maritima TaxID=1793873 RepID=A0ABU1K488_9FLAO|nr:DUF3810 domain-containing protein [Mesonia maritima]MDR6300428.1 hypothetical protein [Mesonia maritima]
MKKKTELILAILLPLQVAGISILADHPNFIETYYSKGIYPHISKFFRYLLGWIPFSIGDFLYAFLLILMLRFLFIRIKTRFKNPKKWVLRTFAFLSILYFSFHIFWGLNYYRLPLHQSLSIEKEYSKTELKNFSKKLIERTVSLHHAIVKNDTVKVDFNFSHTELKNLALQGYHDLENEYPELHYRGKSIKPSLFTIPLTYMGFNGYLNPLTGEAQINNWIPEFKLPTTISHEIGHQLGYAKENEANFIACLNTMNHKNIKMRYAGYTFALKYSLGDLLLQDPCEAENLIAVLPIGIKKNYQEVDLFWKKHENPLEPYFKEFYGGYLQANNQPQGIDSYNYVVALLVNYFEKEGNL